MSKKPSTKTKTQPHRNTQSKTKTSTARVAAPTSAPAAQGVPSPEITTFPPSDCTAGLPASESFHDLTFAELKRLNRTIDDLPYPIVWAEGDRREITKRVVQIIQNYPQANQLLAQRFSGSTIDAIRGVPVGRFMDPSLSDLKKTFAADVPVKDVTRLLDDKSVHAASLSRKPIPISLSDHSVADVLQARPTLVPARNNGKDVLLRLSSHKNTPTVPLQNEYVVRTADSFIRNPVVTSTNGLPVRVRMTGPQLQELSTIGRTRVSLGGHRIVIRTSDTGIPPGKTPAYAAYVSQSRGALEANDSTAYDQPFTEADPSTPTPSTPPIPSKPSQGALPLALYLPWQHRWVLKGYSRGELLHTLELGPQGEATLEISTWDRRKRTFEDSANSEFEQTTDFTDTSKDADSTAREINNQSELGINAGGEVGFKVSEFSVKGTNQNSIKANLANSSKNSLEFLRETVTKATNKLKLQRETKISETTEIGTENKVTRKERNPNLCHTLTLQYYEVLAHYEIITEFNKDDARLCLMDDNPIPVTNFDDTNIRYYESVLRRVLLVPDLANGFDAAKKLFAQSQLCEARRRNQMCTAIGQITNSEDDQKKQLIEKAKRATDAYVALAGSVLYALLIPLPQAFLLPVFWPVLTMVFTPLVPNAVANVQRWLYLQRAKSIAPHLFDVLDKLAELTKPGGAGIDDNALQDLAEAVGAIQLNSLDVSTISKDQDAMYWILRQTLQVPPVPAVFTDVPAEAYAVNDAGLCAMLNTFSESVRALAQAQQAAAAKAAMDANQASVQTDYSNKELAEALESVEALRTHLNQYKNYYRTMILTLLPFPDSFIERLTALPIVERRVVGFDANQVALPINPGLDPRADALLKSLVLDNKNLISTKTSQPVTLPTSGIHVESRLGNCSACEDYILQIRRRDLEAKDADIDLKRETLAQQKQETRRLRTRLEKGDLSDPIAHPPVLRVEADLPPPTPKPQEGTTPTPSP